MKTHHERCARSEVEDFHRTPEKFLASTLSNIATQLIHCLIKPLPAHAVLLSLMWNPNAAFTHQKPIIMSSPLFSPTLPMPLLVPVENKSHLLMDQVRQIISLFLHCCSLFTFLSLFILLYIRQTNSHLLLDQKFITCWFQNSLQGIRPCLDHLLWHISEGTLLSLTLFFS